MDKNKRILGEEYLKKWGKGLYNIEKLQNEINDIKKVRDVLLDIKLQNKEEIVKAYNEVINEKFEYLKSVISEYKFVNDLVEDLEKYQKDAIRYRYIYKKSWQDISLRTHISLRNCFCIKNMLINKIVEQLEETGKK